MHARTYPASTYYSREDLSTQGPLCRPLVNFAVAISVAAAVALSCSGCLDAPRPDPANYDQACATTADCVLVYNGCGTCACGASGAINRRDYDRFDADNRRAFCFPVRLEGDCMCSSEECPSCSSGTCVVVVPVDDGGRPTSTCPP